MRNVEAKFRIADRAYVERRARAIGFEHRATLTQRDTFFATNRGKLKLREEAERSALIYYNRDGVAELKLSHYEIVPVADPAAMRAILADAFGVLAEVRKERTLTMRRNVRLHLDRVDGLGEFGEVEAVLDTGDPIEPAHIEVNEILRALGVSPADLIDASYFELLKIL